MTTNFTNPELKVTACPIPPSDVELAAVKQTSDRLANENSDDAVTERVRKLVADAAELKQAREQNLGPMPSQEVISRLVESKSRRRGF